MSSPPSPTEQMSAGTFSCFLCDAEGFTASGMELHIRTSHSDEHDTAKVSIFSCVYCSFDATCEEDLQQHIQSGHPEERNSAYSDPVFGSLEAAEKQTAEVHVSEGHSSGESERTVVKSGASDNESFGLDDERVKPCVSSVEPDRDKNSMELDSSDEDNFEKCNFVDGLSVRFETFETSLRLNDCPSEKDANHEEGTGGADEVSGDSDTDERAASGSEPDAESNLYAILGSDWNGPSKLKPTAGSSDSAARCNEKSFGGARPKVKTASAATKDPLPAGSSVDAMCNGYSGNRPAEESMMDYTTDRTFGCPLCSYETHSEDDIQHHVNQVHVMEGDEETKTDLSHHILYTCPFCACGFDTPKDLSRHINNVHPDGEVGGGSSSWDWSDIAAGKSKSVTSEAGRHDSETLECPVCGSTFLRDEELLLTAHVSEHFTSSANAVSQVQGNAEADHQMAVKLQQEEDKRQKELNKQFHKIQAQYGMDNSMTAGQQLDRDLEQAVFKGKISTAEYHQAKLSQQQSQRSGVDDGSTQVPGVIESLQQYYGSKSCPRTVRQAHFASSTHHYSGSYGDKGWGCGYRNFQMMLSCLMYDPTYLDVLFNGKAKIPSIQKLQQLIESAWQKGFDRQGCQQLGGKLVNTRKWIGATEIVATLSSLRIRCQLLDIVSPSGPDNTHPTMLKWVRDYFVSARPFKPPLYLQHQGHSRTIVGAEELRNGNINLLLFDPGVPATRMEQFYGHINYNLMQSIRKTANAFRAKQYQIVVVTGVLEDSELERSKTIRSKRIS